MKTVGYIPKDNGEPKGGANEDAEKRADAADAQVLILNTEDNGEPKGGKKK